MAAYPDEEEHGRQEHRVANVPVTGRARAAERRGVDLVGVEPTPLGLENPLGATCQVPRDRLSLPWKSLASVEVTGSVAGGLPNRQRNLP